MRMAILQDVIDMTVPFNTEYERLHNKNRRPTGVSGKMRSFQHQRYS